MGNNRQSSRYEQQHWTVELATQEVNLRTGIFIFFACELILIPTLLETGKLFSYLEKIDGPNYQPNNTQQLENK